MAENAKKQRKPWYQSKTIVGWAVMVAAVLAGKYLKFDVDQETQRQIVEMITVGGFSVGAIVNLWGRLTAKKSITLT